MIIYGMSKSAVSTLIKLLVFMSITGIFGCESQAPSPTPEEVEARSIQALQRAKAEARERAEAEARERIPEKIEEGKNLVKELTKKRDRQLKSLYYEYSGDYKRYHQFLESEISINNIESHEYLLRNCTQYYDICNYLERAAILRHSIQWLEVKIEKINFQVSELEQNIWKMEKRVELSELASAEEQEEISRLIASTAILLEENITPSEKQDLGKIEQEIFNELIE